MPQPPPSIVEACPEKVIAVAADSDSARIRFKAQAAQQAIDELRMAMLQQEEHEAVIAHRRARLNTKRRTYTAPPESPQDKINRSSGTPIPDDPFEEPLGPSQGRERASGDEGPPHPELNGHQDKIKGNILYTSHHIE
jgi:hypothetical protein